MKYRIVFTKTAIETFEAIKNQINNRWGNSIADDFEQRIIGILDLLADSPLMFPISRFDNNLRKGFIHKNCSVFYEVKSDQVVIHFFWDNRQEPLF